MILDIIPIKRKNNLQSFLVSHASSAKKSKTVKKKFKKKNLAFYIFGKVAKALQTVKIASWSLKGMYVLTVFITSSFSVPKIHFIMYVIYYNILKLYNIKIF